MAKKKTTKQAQPQSQPEFQPDPQPKPQPEAPAPTPDPFPVPPADADALHAWLIENLKVTCLRTPMLEGHSAPFDYLCHSFFDAREPPPGGRLVKRTAAPPRDVVLWANRGGGKTFLGAVATLLDLVFKPGIEIRILGGSADQSRRMLEHLRTFFDPRTSEKLAGMVDGGTGGRRIALTNRSSVEILAQSHTSVRGTRVQILRCDEVDIFKRDVWRAAQFVTRSKLCGTFYVAGRVECLSTMHKPHGIMHDIVAECEKGARRLFKWGVLDVLEKCGDEHDCQDARPEALRRSGSAPPNAPDASSTPTPIRPCPLFEECQGRAKEPAAPGGHFIIADALGQKRRSSAGDWQSEMLCLRPSRTHAVLADFDPAVHIGRWAFNGHVLTPEAGGLIESREFLCGMDFGIRGDAAILWAVHGHDDALYIIDECIGPGLTVYQHADIMIRGHEASAQREGRDPWPAPVWLGCDPAGANLDHHGKTCVKTLRDLGLGVRISRGPLQEGLEFVRARLRPADGSRPRLFVHARCERLIEAMTRYHYPEEKPDSLVPVKDGFDHPVDALRYLVRCVEAGGKTKKGTYAA